MPVPIPGISVPHTSDAHAKRQGHVGREINLKALAALIGMGSVAGLLEDAAAVASSGGDLSVVGWSLGSAVLGAAFLFGAVAMWRLNRWGMLAGCAFAVSKIYCAAFIVWTTLSTPPSPDADDGSPASTVLFTSTGVLLGIGLAVLFLILSPKGRRVFSPAYQDLINQTPQISNRLPATTIAALVFLGIGIMASGVVPLLVSTLTE